MLPKLRSIRAFALVPAFAACSQSGTPASSTDSVATPVETPVASSETSPTATNSAPDAAPAATTPEAPEQTKAEFEGFVATRQTCSKDADCVVVSGTCPFGCYIPVVKSAGAEVTAKLQELADRLDKSGQRCVYRCTAPPPAVCRSGRCATGTP
jgi:hypothetical protein